MIIKQGVILHELVLPYKSYLKILSKLHEPLATWVQYERILKYNK